MLDPVERMSLQQDIEHHGFGELPIQDEKIKLVEKDGLIIEVKQNDSDIWDSFWDIDNILDREVKEMLQIEKGNTATVSPIKDFSKTSSKYSVYKFAGKVKNLQLPLKIENVNRIINM